MDNQRNLMLAVLLSGLLFVGWQLGLNYFYPDRFDVPVEEAATASNEAGSEGIGSEAIVQGPVDLETALASENRVAIDAPRVAGSINLQGARIDDLVLKDYDATIEKDSQPVRLFAPENTDEQYFAEFGFVVGGERMPSSALWEADGETLSPATPVTLTRTDDAGITYSIKLSIDDNYMIAAEQMVENTSEAAAIVQPFAFVKRTSTNATMDQFIAYAGPIGVIDGTLYEISDGFFGSSSYQRLTEVRTETPAGAASWLGFTDDYWASALIPGDGETDKAGWRALPEGEDLFRADVIYESATVPAGGSLTESTQLFAGAKESVVLDQYEETGITYFGKAISWGWFEWFEKPLLWLLRTLNGLVGNFGVAIILLTFIIRGLMFPIAQKQFASMAAMKAVQPKMKAIQERYKDDKQQQQQKIMELYKEEKVNPLAGCLPLLIQIPIFFALYKVLILAIEMRHEPFLYISDLATRDPANLNNLLGLGLEPGSFLMFFFGLGILAVLMGFTMWLTFKLNPAAMDPVQQQVFNLMPWFLMFVMAPFAAGLLIYWVTSNVLTLAQQSYLYSKHPQLRAAAEKEKAEKAKEKAREEAEKSKA